MYFFTLVTYNRRPIFNSEKVVRLLKRSISDIGTGRLFKIDAIVIIPDHIHMLMELKDGFSDYSKIISLIKKKFGQELININSYVPSLPVSSVNRKERGVWQRRFWEHIIRDERDYIAHVNYIHLNPVRHGYVSDVTEWKWSSYFAFLKRGFYEEGWIQDDSELVFGTEWD